MAGFPTTAMVGTVTRKPLCITPYILYTVVGTASQSTRYRSSFGLLEPDQKTVDLLKNKPVRLLPTGSIKMHKVFSQLRSLFAYILYLSQVFFCKSSPGEPILPVYNGRACMRYSLGGLVLIMMRLLSICGP